MTKNISDFGVKIERDNGEKEKLRMDNPILPDGSVQSLYFPDNHPTHPGKFKGMVKLLQEQKINAAHLKAQCKDFKCNPDTMHCCCRRILHNMYRTHAPPTILESLAQSLGSRVIFLPKYHCELNPIEQVWGYAKSRYRTYPESSRAVDLRENVRRALAEVPGTSMQQ